MTRTGRPKWPTSNRNGGRLQIGAVAGFTPESVAGFVGIRIGEQKSKMHINRQMKGQQSLGGHQAPERCFRSQIYPLFYGIFTGSEALFRLSH